MWGAPLCLCGSNVLALQLCKGSCVCTSSITQGSKSIGTPVAVYSLCDVHVSTGSGGVQGDPSLIIRLIDAGTVFHQERHHVHVIVYTRLEINTQTWAHWGALIRVCFIMIQRGRSLELRAEVVITLKWPLSLYVCTTSSASGVAVTTALTNSWKTHTHTHTGARLESVPKFGYSAGEYGLCVCVCVRAGGDDELCELYTHYRNVQECTDWTSNLSHTQQ